MLQFHGDEPPEFCTQFGLMSMKAFRIRDAESLKKIPDYLTDAYLLDAFSSTTLGGTGEKFNWDLAVAAQKFGKPIFLAGGLTPENVAEAVKKVQPFGVDVSSGVEISSNESPRTFDRLENRIPFRHSGIPTDCQPPGFGDGRRHVEGW
jgi:phosphoribosylanthranilate isomerase